MTSSSRAANAGVGQMNSEGSRTIVYGAAASNASAPSHVGARTETRSGGSSLQSASSVRWIPPTRGG